MKNKPKLPVTTKKPSAAKTKPRSINPNPAPAIPQPSASNTLYVIGRKGQMVLLRERPQLHWHRWAADVPPSWTLYARWPGVTLPALLPVNFPRRVIEDQGTVLVREVRPEMVERVEAARAEIEEAQRRLNELERLEQKLLYEAAEQGAEVRVKGMLPPKPLG